MTLMGPPPDPALILEPEVDALLVCLRNAVVNAGQIYRYSAITKRLPPHSLTNALGRQVEKYEQLCDTIESQLLRAISVLERDLAREECKFEESKKAAISVQTRSKSPSPSPIQMQADTNDSSQIPTGPSILSNSPMPPIRRPSIFLSSLQRPLPLPKLDLSAISRVPTEDSSLFSGGLTSPVTLAPRSARITADLPPELMAFASGSGDGVGEIDLDLTVPDETHTSPAEMNTDGILDSALGSSAEKPIDLDLMTTSELFGDGGTNDGLFSPADASPDLGANADGKTIGGNQEEEDIGMGIFDALHQTHENQDIFASLTAAAVDAEQQQQGAITADQIGSQSSLNAPMAMPSRTSSGAVAPSPGTLLASLGSTSNMTVDDSMSGDASFDFDLAELGASIFSTPPNEMSLEELFNMSGQSGLDANMGDADGVLGA